MRRAGIGQPTQTETDREQVERLVNDAQHILEMTSNPGWMFFFDPLRQTAADALRNLLTEEDSLEIFRHQATLEVARKQMADLRRPFEELRRLDPGHPLAVQDLPCAEVFDVTLALSLIVPNGAEALIENDRRSRAAHMLQKVLALVKRSERAHTIDQELDSGDDNDVDASSGSRPGSRKLKHPWRASYVDRN
jgi:hypothetical protein